MILFPTSFPSIWAWYKISTPKLKKNVLLSNGLWRPSWNLGSRITCPRINSGYPPEIIIRDANEEDSAVKKNVHPTMQCYKKIYHLAAWLLCRRRGLLYTSTNHSRVYYVTRHARKLWWRLMAQSEKNWCWFTRISY